ncbi:hypothetical protein J2W48_000782 [Flavobacterium piscis]|uniref:Bacteriocin n=1 Tax=Flavobacterium piscis TaxID=1114874 RepID=A0ABU1Y3P6_9FLAO|nr:hypothetical protein [Flavobacterium piscis]
MSAKQKEDNTGGCSGSTKECGKTDDGRVIVGEYNT